MADNNDVGYNSKRSLPNKLLQDDGTITDILGNPVGSATEVYNSKVALPNKFLNPNGSYSTLNEIIAGAIDTDLFIIVQELPTVGEENKIYLVPKDSGNGFVEWVYADGQWDTIGELEIDLSNYPTNNDMNTAIAKNTDYYYFDAGVVADATGTDYTSGDLFNFWKNLYDPTNNKSFMVCIKCQYNSSTYIFVWYFENHNMISGTFYRGYDITGIKNKHFAGIGESHIINWNTTVSYTIENGIVTKIHYGSFNGTVAAKYLNTDQNYTTPYTPQYPGSPATKKYVDDNIDVYYYNRGNTPATSVELTSGDLFDFWKNLYDPTNDRPFIVCSEEYYTVSEYGPGPTTFKFVWYFENHNITDNINGVAYVGIDTSRKSYISNSGYTVSSIYSQQIRYGIENGEVTKVIVGARSGTSMTYLSTNYNYSPVYTPQYDGSPATKKYVDDAITTNITAELGGEF